MYQKPHLDQVLFSIGLAFMAVAGVDYFAGSSQQNVQLPERLRGRTELGEGAWQLGMGHYRLFIIALCAALTVALQAVLTRTRFGSRLRAAVDDPRVAAGLGINVNQVFLLTFAVGSAWPAWAALWGRGAGAGAELSAQVHDLLPHRGRGGRHLVHHRAAAGRAAAGRGRRGGQVLHPKLGAFIVYTLMIMILLWRPQGLFAAREGAEMAADRSSPCTALLRRARPRGWEFALGRWPWWRRPRCPPMHYDQRDRHRGLFAISLDLILGYTGIVSLGHAAFFGGAYSAALFAKLVMPDPTVGLLVATLLCTALGALCSATILRGSDLTRLMVTLGTALILLELANKLDWRPAAPTACRAW
jgi:branched-chain amino acid transport system permease protein